MSASGPSGPLVLCGTGSLLPKIQYSDGVSVGLLKLVLKKKIGRQQKTFKIVTKRSKS